MHERPRETISAETEGITYMIYPVETKDFIETEVKVPNKMVKVIRLSSYCGIAVTVIYSIVRVKDHISPKVLEEKFHMME